MDNFVTETDLPANLNKAQLEAVITTEGFVRVIAGAGSGKTRALAYRAAYLMNVLGVPPENILCVTFTNRAAAVMRNRIRALTGGVTGHIATFHSFCVTILQEDSAAVLYPKSFLVLDNADIDSMLQIIYDERGLSLRDMTFGNARDMIEIRKLFDEPDYYRDMIALPLESLRQKYLAAQKTADIIFYGYLYQEKKCFALDYNDLIKFVLFIFESNDDIRLKWQQRLEYIMIDEFQDIDIIQYQLMEALCGCHRNLFVVGDPDQTIYTWRGANIKFLLEFDEKFPGTHTVMMTHNYRSTPEIVRCANSLISHNKARIKKDLSAENPSGCVPQYFHARTTEDEATWIAERVKTLTAGGVQPGDIAVLYRAHYISRALEESFAAEDIPFTLYSGIPFFEREEIKDALAYLRMIVCRDDLSFRRIVNKPRRNIGKTRIAALERYAAENGCTLYESLCSLVDSPESGGVSFSGTLAPDFIALVTQFTEESKQYAASELLGRILDTAGYEKMLRTEGSQTRLDNLAELKQSAYEFEKSCGEECSIEYYLAHTALMTGLDAGSTKSAVRFMSIHTAKGLEFPHVVICGLCEGMFPSRKARDRAAMEEERRLAFVAVTRAAQTLALTDAEGRNLDGSIRFPSRFIFDIDRALLDYVTELDDSFKGGAQSFISASEREIDMTDGDSTFELGDRVRHCILGTGTVTALDTKRRAYVIQFDRLPTPRSISFRIQLERE